MSGTKREHDQFLSWPGQGKRRTVVKPLSCTRMRATLTAEELVAEHVLHGSEGVDVSLTEGLPQLLVTGGLEKTQQTSSLVKAMTFAAGPCVSGGGWTPPPPAPHLVDDGLSELAGAALADHLLGRAEGRHRQVLERRQLSRGNLSTCTRRERGEAERLSAVAAAAASIKRPTSDGLDSPPARSSMPPPNFQIDCSPEALNHSA